MLEEVLLTRVNPPVPDHVKLVAFAMFRMTAAAVVLVNAMLELPNAMERLLATEETNVPVLAVNPLRSKVPRVSVVEFVTVRASPSV